MSEENLKFSSEILEPEILKKAVRDPSFLIKIKTFLNTEKFKDKSYFRDKKYQYIFNKICFIFEKIEKLPKKVDVQYIIDKTIKDADEKLYLNAVINKIYDEEMKLSDEIVEEETIKFIKEARVYEAFLISQGYFTQGNFSKILTEMEDALRVNFDKDLGKEITDVSFVDDLNEVYSGKLISSGYPKIDKILGGGFTSDTITFIAGLPGTGKSIFLMLFAINAYLQGKKVLFITLEMSDEKTAARGLSNILGIKKSEILTNPSNVKEKMKEFDANGGSLIIKEYPANTASSNDFEAYLKDLKTHKNWEPDIIFVDYLLIMSANDKTLPRAESYQYHKYTSIELRNIAKVHHIPVVSAVQLNRGAQQEGKGGSKNMVTSQNLSESRAILDNADFLFTIIQTEKDKKENLIALYSDKARDEANGQRVRFNMDYEHMRASEVE